MQAKRVFKKLTALEIMKRLDHFDTARSFNAGVHFAELEALIIRTALERYDNNQTKAATSLGLTEHALRYKMKIHGIPSSTQKGLKKPGTR